MPDQAESAGETNGPDDTEPGSRAGENGVSKRPRKARWLRGRWRMALALTVFAVFSGAVIALVAVFYNGHVQRHRDDALVALSQIARLKADEVALWVRERVADAQVLMDDRALAVNVSEWLENAHPQAFRRDSVPFLDAVYQRYGYSIVAVLGPSGRVRYSVSGRPVADLERVDVLLARSLLGDSVGFSDLYLGEDGTPYLDWVVPLIVGEGEQRRGVGGVLLRADPAGYLYPVLAMWPGRSDTAETLLVRREGKSVLFLTDPRFGDHEALKFRLPLAQPGLPAAAAALGQRGAGEGIDYRGKEVLVAYRPVPWTDWGLVAKVDKSDIYAPIRREAWLVVVLVAALLSAGGLAMGLLWRGRELQVARAEALAAGEAEVALRQSEWRYRTAFEGSADAMFLLTDVFKDCNVAAERLFGCRRDEIVGRGPADYSPPRQPDGRDSQTAAGEWITRALAGEPVRFDWRQRRASGELLDCDVGLAALDVGGERIVQATVRDVTERRRDQARLARLTRLYRVLSAANEAIVRTRSEPDLFEELCDVFVEEGGVALAWVGMVTADGRVEPVARAGRDLDYVDGLGIVVADEPQGRGTTGRAVRHGRVEACNDVARDPGMRPWRDEAARRRLLSSCSLPLMRGGRAVGALSLYWGEPGFLQEEELSLMKQLADDVSFALQAFDQERRRAAAEHDLRALSASLERRVEERTAELRTANRELEAFSYSVSHDLRAPLRAIDGFSQALVEDFGEQLPQDGRQYLARVRAAAQRMAELIDDLLLLSRVTRAEMDVIDLDMSATAQVVATGVAEHHPDSLVTFNAAPGITARAAPSLVRVLRENLFDNAWKFSAPVSRPLVEFGADVKDGRQVLFVRDNGVGFDLEHADNLFAPFQRFHSAQEFEGTGVGLATVQRIVMRHGGRVWAESEPGRGATFFFTWGEGIQ